MTALPIPKPLARPVPLTKAKWREVRDRLAGRKDSTFICDLVVSLRLLGHLTLGEEGAARDYIRESIGSQFSYVNWALSEDPRACLDALAAVELRYEGAGEPRHGGAEEFYDCLNRLRGQHEREVASVFEPGRLAWLDQIIEGAPE